MILADALDVHHTIQNVPRATAPTAGILHRYREAGPLACGGDCFRSMGFTLLSPAKWRQPIPSLQPHGTSSDSMAMPCCYDGRTIQHGPRWWLTEAGWSTMTEKDAQWCGVRPNGCSAQVLSWSRLFLPPLCHCPIGQGH